jgi:GxxExxY protein
LESTYEHCLAHELQIRGLLVERRMSLPLVYEGAKLDAGYRIDLMVEKAVIVEVKAIESLTPVHHAQLLTYMKLSGCRIGFLMNFHTALFKHGLKRLVLQALLREILRALVPSWLNSLPPRKRHTGCGFPSRRLAVTG